MHVLNKESTAVHRQASKQTEETHSVLERAMSRLPPPSLRLSPPGCAKHTPFCPSLGPFSELQFLSGMFPPEIGTPHLRLGLQSRAQEAWRDLAPPQRSPSRWLLQQRTCSPVWLPAFRAVLCPPLRARCPAALLPRARAGAVSTPSPHLLLLEGRRGSQKENPGQP